MFEKLTSFACFIVTRSPHALREKIFITPCYKIYFECINHKQNKTLKRNRGFRVRRPNQSLTVRVFVLTVEII